MRHAIVVTALLAAACATPRANLSASDRAELAAAMAEPLTFTVPREQAADAWGRAQVFLVQRAGRHLATATEYVIETARRSSTSADYTITKTPAGDGFRFDVSYVSARLLERSSSEAAHLCAHYVRTGEMLCVSCLAR